MAGAGGTRLTVEVLISVGDEVRIYGDDDWFNTGRVSEIDDEADTVDVDFADWIQRYPRAALREAWPLYERVLIPWETGETVEDYRDPV